MNEAESRTRSLVAGAGVMLPATLVGSAALLMVDIFASHILSLGDYGLYGALRRAVQIGGFVALLGMENAVIRVIARDPDAAAARAGTRGAFAWTFAAAVLLAALTFVAAPTLAQFVDDSPDTVSALRLAACALPFWAIRTISVAAAQGWGSLWPRALVTFVAWPAVQLLGLYIAVYEFSFGVNGAVAGFGVAVAAGAFQGAWHLWRLRPDRFAPVADPGEGALAPMWAVAWPQWVHGVSMALYTWLDQVLLVGLAGAVEAGRYGPVAQLTPLFAMGLGALNSAFAPLIARHHAEGDRAGLAAQYRMVTRWALVLAVPPVAVALAVPMCVLSPWASASAETGTGLRIVAATQLICTAVGSVNYLLVMSGRARDPLWNAVPAVLVSAGASWWLIPSHGAVGAAAANGAAMLVANLGGLAQVWRHLHIHPFHAALTRPLLAGVGVAAVALAITAWLGNGVPALVAIAVVGGVVYAALLAALGFDDADRNVLAALRRKVAR